MVGVHREAKKQSTFVEIRGFIETFTSSFTRVVSPYLTLGSLPPSLHGARMRVDRTLRRHLRLETAEWKNGATAAVSAKVEAREGDARVSLSESPIRREEAWKCRGTQGTMKA